MPIFNESVWRDFSEREKFEWLKLQIINLDSILAAISRHIDEIGNAVKDIEEKLGSKK
jgi:hypothetical protein